MMETPWSRGSNPRHCYQYQILVQRASISQAPSPSTVLLSVCPVTVKYVPEESWARRTRRERERESGFPVYRINTGITILQTSSPPLHYYTTQTTIRKALSRHNKPVRLFSSASDSRLTKTSLIPCNEQAVRRLAPVALSPHLNQHEDSRLWR